MKDEKKLVVGKIEERSFLAEGIASAKVRGLLNHRAGLSGHSATLGGGFPGHTQLLAESLELSGSHVVWTGAGLDLATQRPIDSGTGRAAQAGGSLLSAPRKLWLGTIEGLEIPRRLKFPWGGIGGQGEKRRWPGHWDRRGSHGRALSSHDPVLNPAPPLASWVTLVASVPSSLKWGEKQTGLTGVAWSHVEHSEKQA